jgi:integrase
MRHTFATRLIAKWSQNRVPLSRNLLPLSRYMGHKNFNETWWYVSPDNTALGAAAVRFHAFQKTSTQHNDQP